jgi:hypothetical protein
MAILYFSIYADEVFSSNIRFYLISNVLVFAFFKLNLNGVGKLLDGAFASIWIQGIGLYFDFQRQVTPL